MTDLKDYYALLDVDPKASPGEVKAAWRRESFRCHPDRGGGSGDGERFLALGEAISVLLDPQARSRYDRRWRQAFGAPEFEGRSETPFERAVDEAEQAALGDDIPGFADEEDEAPAAEAAAPEAPAPSPVEGAAFRRQTELLARELASGDRRRRSWMRYGAPGTLLLVLLGVALWHFGPMRQREAWGVVVAAAGIVLGARTRAEVELAVERHREMARTLLERRQRETSEGVL